MSTEKLFVGAASSNSVEEGELDDLWRVFFKRKLTALIGFGAVLLLVGVYLIITPPVYSSSAVLMIGSLTDKSQKKAGYDVLMAEIYALDLSVKMSVDRKVKRLVRLSATGGSPERAQMKVQEALDKIMERHTALYDDWKASKLHQLQRLNQGLAKAKRYASELQSILSGAPDQTVVIDATLMTIRLDQRVEALEREIEDINNSLLEINSAPTRVIKLPSLPKRSSKPDIKMFSVLGILLALMVGIFAAFVHDSLIKAKTKA